MAAKTKPYQQMESLQDKAGQFLKDVVGDEEKADEIADSRLEEYAES